MFRRSGSVACFFVDGSLPDPLGDAFSEALSNQRFRTIENAADEATAVGWVTQGDPTGGTFEREDLDFETAIWLRMRIDKKAAPTKWLQIHRQAAERSAGRSLSLAERKDLKEDLLSKLMPRVLPSINLVDALYVSKQRMIMLFATSSSVREAFLSLFYRTFSISLEAADPHRLALSLDLDSTMQQGLREVAPIRWHSEGDDRRHDPARSLDGDPVEVRAEAVS